MASRLSDRARSLAAPLRTALLCLVSFAFALAVLEIGLRATGYRPLYEVYSKSSQFWRADPLLGWSHQPGAEGTFVGPRPWPIEFEAPVRINSLGLRGPEVEPLPEGGLRVLLLGDSMVAGFEVPYEETFGAHLERRLERELGVPIQVVNAGVRGYGTDQSYLYYRERGRDLHADLVALFASGNDPENNVTLHRMRRPFAKPAFALTSEGLSLRNQPTPEYPICSHFRMSRDFEVQRLDGRATRAVCAAQIAALDHSALFGFAVMRLQRNPGLVSRLYHLGSSGAPAESAPDGLDYRAHLTTELVLELARSVRADGSEFLLVGEDYAIEGLDRSALELAGIQPYGVTPSDASLRFHNDAHFNALGHRQIGKTMTSLVVARLEAPLPGGTEPSQLASQPDGRPEEPATIRVATGRFGG
jgi:hypothetical protein